MGTKVMYLMLISDPKNTMAWHLSPKQMAQSNFSQRYRARHHLTKGTQKMKYN